ncbi:MAG: hypothetical protein HGJ94_21840 [Desulfosarcina sp.]|nr:hypothetical protein [Desulfosarcina sp.]MBC2742618.1 hypothetical protein [Desulfosarcina sp.]MBC2765528.1 hypothetical protein [Desulfosarcina sp.]
MNHGAAKNASQKSKRDNKLPSKGIHLLLFFVCLGGLIFGCASGFAYYRRSLDVSVQFEKGEVIPDHRYYVGGPKQKPNAIVAIQNDYQLESEHWTEVSVTPDTLKQMLQRIGHVDGAEYKERQFMHNGARLFAPDGRQIGLWYSVFDYSQVRFLEGNRVYLSYPPSHLPPNVRVPGFERDIPYPY